MTGHGCASFCAPASGPVPDEGSAMAKGLEKKKEAKKEPTKTLKEKRAAKQEKKAAKK